MSGVASQMPNVQYAALPWRKAEGEIQILLVTTLNTRRWIVPKGWPLAGHTPGECAALEALEEAGVLGEVAAETLGTFHYKKRRKSGEIVPCKVHVFPMEVVRQRRNWAEKKSRKSRWYSLEEARARVTEPGLRRLIGKFAKASNGAAPRRAPGRTPPAR